MNSGDAFERSRELTDQLRDELRDIRRDVEALVEGEVRRATDPGRIEALVREAVRREMTARSSWLVTNAAWLAPVAAALVGLALGLSVFAIVSVRARTPQAAEQAAIVIDPAPAARSVLPVETPDPANVAARYDSLFAARDTVFEPLLRLLERPDGNSTVRAAAAAWRLGRMNETYRGVLHSAFVQLALHELDPTIPVDGGFLRNPCRGTSCDALLRLWRVQGESFAMPPYHAGAANDSAAVRVAERVLVMHGLESDG
ncbi:MAG: hypothetical protein ACREMQ_20510 [Longimicrobiales bacterium]